MGREIRKVPQGWEHPRHTEENLPPGHDSRRLIGEYRPCYDTTYDQAMKGWETERAVWNAENGHPPGVTVDAFVDWHGQPPDYWDYLPRDDRERTHYQMYETVSEGTPVSPVFADLESLRKWLVTHERWTPYKAAEFVKDGWAPSAVA